MTDTQARKLSVHQHPFFWAAIFALCMAAIAAGEITEFILFPWNLPLMAAASLALYPLTKSANLVAAAAGVQSPAVRAYNRRMMIWSLCYVIALGIAITIKNQMAPAGPLLWVIALLPSLPVLYLFWAVARYFVEEADEYLRVRQMEANIFAAGFLLSAATVWGFLEMFGVAPHAQGWIAVPVWAIGLALAPVWRKVRGA
jgi:hypothetical protein